MTSSTSAFFQEVHTTRRSATNGSAAARAAALSLAGRGIRAHVVDLGISRTRLLESMTDVSGTG